MANTHNRKICYNGAVGGAAKATGNKSISQKKYIRKSCDLFGIFNISALPTKMMLCNLNLFPLSFPLVYILYKAVEIELL